MGNGSRMADAKWREDFRRDTRIGMFWGFVITTIAVLSYFFGCVPEHRAAAPYFVADISPEDLKGSDLHLYPISHPINEAAVGGCDVDRPCEEYPDLLDHPDVESPDLGLPPAPDLIPEALGCVPGTDGWPDGVECDVGPVNDWDWHCCSGRCGALPGAYVCCGTTGRFACP